jgi:hypothetical protein
LRKKKLPRTMRTVKREKEGRRKIDSTMTRKKAVKE